MEVAIINRMWDGPLLGFTYFPIGHDNDFSELNLYLLFFIVHIKVYNK
tara:strand:- start:35 stop:178 length:144 start_codon:yes stop_codon:yes gene_type:complete